MDFLSKQMTKIKVVELKALIDVEGEKRLGDTQAVRFVVCLLLQLTGFKWGNVQK